MALRLASLALLGLVASASVAELLSVGADADGHLLPEALLTDDACASLGDQGSCGLALLQRSGLRARTSAGDQARATVTLAEASEVGETEAKASPRVNAGARVAKLVEAEDMAGVPPDGFIFALEAASGNLECLSRYTPMGNSEDQLLLLPGCNGLGAGSPARFTWWGRGSHPGFGKLAVVTAEPCSRSLCLTYSSDLGLFFAECGVAQWWTASKGALQTATPDSKCLRTVSGSFKLEDCAKKASEPQHFYALQPKDIACAELGCSRYCNYECKAVGSSK